MNTRILRAAANALIALSLGTVMIGLCGAALAPSILTLDMQSMLHFGILVVATTIACRRALRWHDGKHRTTVYIHCPGTNTQRSQPDGSEHPIPECCLTGMRRL